MKSTNQIVREPNEGLQASDTTDPAQRDLTLEAMQYIADSKPREVQRRLSNIDTARYGLSGRTEVSPLDKAIAGVARRYDEKAVRHFGRRMLCAGLTVGAAAGTYGVIELGAVKYGLREGLDMRPDNVEGQLLPGNVLTAEKFDEFTIGDATYTLPDLRTLTYGKYVTHIVIRETEGTASASTIPDIAKNPYSPDLQLTGQEAEIDRRISSELLAGIIAKGGAIDTIRVEGIVSDDFRGEIGKPNPEQTSLAVARTDVAASALANVAKEKGIAIPNIIKSSTEAVLTQEQVGMVEAIAVENHMTVKQLLNVYNKGEELSKNARELLDKVIIRGANYTVNYTTQAEEETYALERAGEETDTWKPWKQFSIVGGGTGILTAGYGSIVALRRVPRRRRKLVRNDLKNLENSTP